MSSDKRIPKVSSLKSLRRPFESLGQRAFFGPLMECTSARLKENHCPFWQAFLKNMRFEDTIVCVTLVFKSNLGVHSVQSTKTDLTMTCNAMTGDISEESACTKHVFPMCTLSGRMKDFRFQMDTMITSNCAICGLPTFPV